MMPDLGKYALWVLASYGISLALLAALVAVSVLQARRVLAELRRMEEGSAAPRAARGAAGSGAVAEKANG